MIQRILWAILFLMLSANPAWATVSVRLAWTASSSASVIGYRVYYGTATGVYNHVADTDQLTYLITGVNEALPCYFAVKAYSGTQESAYSTELRGAVIAQSVQGQGTIEAKQEDWSETTDDAVFVVESGTSKDVVVTLTPNSVDYRLAALSLDGSGVTPVASPLTIPNVTANHTVFGIFTRVVVQNSSGATLKGTEYQHH